MPKKIRKLAEGDYIDYGAGDEFGDEPQDEYGNTTSSDMVPADETTSGYASAGDGGAYTTDPNATNASTLAPFQALQQRQQDSLQMLKDAQARAVAALQPKQDKSAMWLAVAQGLLSPTRTGSFGESLGNAAGGAAPYAQHYADADLAGKEKVSQMDYGLAQSLYNQSIKPPQIIDWYAHNPDGTVGKQKAMIVNGQPVPFGDIFTPGGGGNNLTNKVDALAKMTPEQRALFEKYLMPKQAQTITNVNSGTPNETESQKKAADRLDDLFKAADSSRSLAAQLNAMQPYIDKTPKAYFGPLGPGLVTAGKAMNQLGFNVGDGLDNASFVQAIMSHLGPAQRIVGSGSSSDRDVQLFMNSLPGLSNTKEGNQMLVKYYNKLNDYNQRLVKIIRNAAKTRKDFYGTEDLTQDEINQAGRVFSDADLQDMQRAAGASATTGHLPKGGLNMAPPIDNGDSITLNPG